MLVGFTFSGFRVYAIALSCRGCVRYLSKAMPKFLVVVLIDHCGKCMHGVRAQAEIVIDL